MSDTATSYTNYTIYLVLFIGVIVGSILFQIFLSKMESKWPGLILPGILFLISLIFVMNIIYAGDMTVGDMIITIITMMILSNIPTIILLGIYFGIRGRKNKKSQLDKMNIHDF